MSSSPSQILTEVAALTVLQQVTLTLSAIGLLLAVLTLFQRNSLQKKKFRFERKNFLNEKLEIFYENLICHHRETTSRLVEPYLKKDKEKSSIFDLLKEEAETQGEHIEKCLLLSNLYFPSLEAGIIKLKKLTEAFFVEYDNIAFQTEIPITDIPSYKLYFQQWRKCEKSVLTWSKQNKN